MEGHDRQRYKAWHRMMMMMMITVGSRKVHDLTTYVSYPVV